MIDFTRAKVLAKRGEQEYLIALDGRRGCVFDAADAVLYPEHSIDSILARGYWEPFQGDGSAILKAAAEEG